MISEPPEPGDVNASAGVLDTRSRTSPALIALAWAVVGIPAAWGIYMTVLTSILLFHPTAPNPHAAAPAPVANSPK
jgi:hypothetical protein